jgi:hypothetical protein
MPVFIFHVPTTIAKCKLDNFTCCELEQVTKEIEWLNQSSAEEVCALEEQLQDVDKLTEERYQEIRVSLEKARQRFRVVDTALEDPRLDPQMKTLRKERTSIDDRSVSESSQAFPLIFSIFLGVLFQYVPRAHSDKRCRKTNCLQCYTVLC